MFFIFNINLVFAEKQVIDVSLLRLIALPLHIIELIIAIFVCVLALKFFHLTKPFNFFLFVYVSLGFFIINSLLYILLYVGEFANINISFINVYLGARFSLIAMLVCIGYLFFYIHTMMKRKIETKGN
tara:strand:+ start:285 stop:668 length:384 start_codon:yes stop_codon:yes gene_type:complete